jgi:hypothetical protein
MTLNVSEATDVNTLALWMLRRPSDWRSPSESDAKEALTRLVEKAHKTLAAGMFAKDVTERWLVTEISIAELPWDTDSCSYPQPGAQRVGACPYCKAKEGTDCWTAEGSRQRAQLDRAKAQTLQEAK